MENDIKGRWHIRSWTQEYDDGRVVHPFGEQLDGFIEYGDGTMFCLLTKVPRTRFATGGQWSAADTDKARAYDEFLSYAGGYSIDGDTVTHHVELCIFPDWQGGRQRRRIVWGEDGGLTLVARIEEGTSEARTAKLSWRRAQAGGRPS